MNMNWKTSYKNWVTAICLAACAGMAFIYYKAEYLDFKNGARELPALFSEASRIGYPLTAKDITAEVRIGPELDPIDAEILKCYYDRRRKEAQTFPGKPWNVHSFLFARPTQSSAAKARQRIEVANPFINMSAELLLKSKHKVGVLKDWDLCTKLLFPEFAVHKELLQFLACRAILHAYDSDAFLALKDLKTCVEILESMHNHPSVVGMLVHIAEVRMICKTAVLCMDLLPARALEFASVLDSIKPLDPRYALRGEAYYDLAIIRNYGIITNDFDPKSQRDMDRVLRSGLPRDEQARAYLAVNMRNWMPLMKACDLSKPLDLPTILREMISFDKRSSSLGAAPINKIEVVLSPIIAQTERAYEMRYESIACAKALAKAIDYWLRTKRAPGSLAELGVSPTVPMVCTKINMRVTKDEIRVYGFGSDRVDNGGYAKKELPQPQDDSDGPGDEVVVFHIPKKTR